MAEPVKVLCCGECGKPLLIKPNKVWFCKSKNCFHEVELKNTMMGRICPNCSGLVRYVQLATPKDNLKCLSCGATYAGG